MSCTRVECEALERDFLEQAVQTLPLGEKNLAALFFLQRLHCLVLEAPDTTKLPHPSLTPALMALSEGRLKPAEELKEIHLLLTNTALIKNHGLVATSQELHQNLSELLDLQPAGTCYPEENNSLSTLYVHLKTKPCVLRSVHVLTISRSVAPVNFW